MSVERYRLQILNFLRSDPYIPKVNFMFQGYKVYPSCFRVDVRNAIDNEDIEVKTENFKGRLVAQYKDDMWVFLCDDDLVVSNRLNMSSIVERSYILHECTHAHLDNQNLGDMQRDLNEAICYTAQHAWLMAFDQANPNHNVAMPQGAIHAAARAIGQQIIAGSYAVNSQLANTLRNAIRSDPEYAAAIRKHPTISSDGV